MKKVLIISFTDQRCDPRVNRQIKFLVGKYEIYTIGLRSAEEKNIIFYPLERKKNSFLRNVKKAVLCKINEFERVYWDTFIFETLLTRLKGQKFDLIIPNDIESLPLTLKIANGAKVLLDVHEYTPREFEDRFIWNFFLKNYKDYLCRKYIKNCDKVITVSEGIANEYSNNYGIKPPVVITNACEYQDIKPQPTDKQNIRLIHHGYTIPSRKLEIMIKLMDHLDKRFSLDFMLVDSNSGYYKFLKALANNKSNIRFIEPVPMEKIVMFTNQYDIGIFILPPTTFNYRYTLPNKFFEFIQARLAVVIGPSPEMAKIVNRYDLGIVSDDFKPETMAKELNKLTKDKIEYYKCRSDKFAQELSSECNRQKFESLVENLLI